MGNFTSALLGKIHAALTHVGDPAEMGAADESLDALLPVLYLRGISTGDFQEALAALLGKDAPNLSPSVIGRLDGADNHSRLKKRIVRTLINEVVADLDDGTSEIVLVIHWVGGVHTELRLPKRCRGQRNATPEDIVDAVRQLGITPRANSSGGKERLGKISKQGNKQLRTLLIVGATSILKQVRRGVKLPAWVISLVARRPYKVAAVALANKMARTIWALLVKGGTYQPPTSLVTA